MNSRNKPDSVYCATENHLNKPSTLFDFLVSVSSQLQQFGVRVRILISFDYRRPAHNPKNEFKNTFVVRSGGLGLEPP